MRHAGGTGRWVVGRARPIAGARPVRGFTLIELILVILLLALFAAVTAPRLTGTQSRRADLEADAVRSLLSITAHRAATTTEPLALVYDEQTATFSVEVRRGRAVSAGGVEELAWRRDDLIAPVTLSLTELHDASTDLYSYGKRSWRIVLPVTEPRAAISLTLGGRGADAARTWAITLGADAPAATMMRPGSTSPPRSLPAAIDLDAAGRGTQPW